MAKKATKGTVVETMPSETDTVSALASATAPFIFFNTAPAFGFEDNVAHITLEAFRYTNVNNKPLTDRVMVAHLRTRFRGLQLLKEAIEGIELLANPAPEGRPH